MTLDRAGKHIAASMDKIWGPRPPAVQEPRRQGDEKIKCPHCETTGQVRTQRQKQKKGVSGGKAAAAVLTAGLSVLGTGLSRKENVTVAVCDNCGVRWTIG